MNCLKPVLVILVCLLSFKTISCSQSIDTLNYENPDKVVAELICSKRAVMLGEMPHHHPVGHYGVFKILDEWLNLIIDGKCSSSKLTLILEIGEQDEIRINSFIENGNYDSLYGSYNMELMEFHTNLRKFKMKIDSINLVNNSDIRFSIKGFEEIGSANIKENYYLKSKKDSELWFVNERDEYTSKGIIKYLKENPDDKALLFYGSAHLLDGLVDKNLGFDDLARNETMGHYIAYYLKKEFGSDNVITIAQPVFPYWNLKGTDLEKAGEKSILVIKKNLPNSDFFGFDKYDFTLFRPLLYFPEHPIGYAFSRKVIEKSLSTLKILEPLLSGHIAQRIYGSNLSYLMFITGKNFSNTKEIETWYNNNAFNGLERLTSAEFDEQVFSEMFNNPSRNRWFRNILHHIGFSQDILGEYYMPDSTRWKAIIWPDAKKTIVFLNCIGIYWVGYPDEKVKAKEYLVKFSGQDFDEPEKYLQWYRMKYYGYEY